MSRGDVRGRRLWVLCTLAVAAGCATPSASSAPVKAGGETGRGTATQTSGSGGSTPSPAPECPAKYGDSGPSCDGPTPMCSYPEGDCYCGEEPVCSGVERPPVPPRWVCVKRRPPCPAPGTRCKGNAQCAPWCCGMGVVCKGGVYVEEHFPCPP